MSTHSILLSSWCVPQPGLAGRARCNSAVLHELKNTLWYPGSVKPVAVTSEAFGNFFQSTVIGGAVVTNQTLTPLSAA